MKEKKVVGFLEVTKGLEKLRLANADATSRAALQKMVWVQAHSDVMQVEFRKCVAGLEENVRKADAAATAFLAGNAGVLEAITAWSFEAVPTLTGLEETPKEMNANAAEISRSCVQLPAWRDQVSKNPLELIGGNH